MGGEKIVSVGRGWGWVRVGICRQEREERRKGARVLVCVDDERAEG